MRIWLDAQISPSIAQWLSSTCHVEAIALKDLGLRDALDRDIFVAAREAKAVVLTKDRDLVDLVMQAWPTAADLMGDVREYVECKIEGDPHAGLADSRSAH